MTTETIVFRKGRQSSSLSSARSDYIATNLWLSIILTWTILVSSWDRCSYPAVGVVSLVDGFQYQKLSSKKIPSSKSSKEYGMSDEFLACVKCNQRERTAYLQKHNKSQQEGWVYTQVKKPCHRRRDFLSKCILPLTAMVAQYPSVNSNRIYSGSVAIAVMDPTQQKAFEVGKDLTTTEALERFKLGVASLEYLIDNFDSIVADGGGDNIRRYLGTVGVTSGLYGIGKVLKTLRDSDPELLGVDDKDFDVVEISELIDDVIGAIGRADGSAYMSIFTTFSSSSVPPAKYYKDSKAEASQALIMMRDIAKQLGLST